MRKKTLSNFFDNLFWYILYLLPVILYVFYFLIPREVVQEVVVQDTIYQYNIDESKTLDLIEDPDNPLYGYDEYEFGWFNNFTIYFYPGELNLTDLFIGAPLHDNFISFNMFYISPFALDGGEDLVRLFTSIRLPLYYTNYIQEDSDGIYSYGFSSLNNHSFYSSFSLDLNYEKYSVICLYPVESSNFSLRYLGSATTQDLVEYFVPVEINDTAIQYVDGYSFSSFIDNIGFSFATDNIVVNSLEEIFGANGVMPIFSTNTPFIIFAWFICVFLIHLVVDFLLFLPRLAHKWMNEFGGD